MPAPSDPTDVFPLRDLGAPGLSVAADEVRFEFLRASGPGGQNVNKVATAVRLTFDVHAARRLPDDVKARLLAAAGTGAARDGVVRIVARRFRTQLANRRDAVARLAALVRRAAVPPKVRRKTKPTRASKERRLEEKRRTSRKKAQRRTRPDDA